MTEPRRRGPVQQAARRSCAALIVCLAIAGCARKPADAAPSIEFTVVPEAAPGGPDRMAPVAGRTRGARAEHRVVLFARSGAWWVQPFRFRPFTTIQPDSTWKSTIHLGTEYAALLVDSEFYPPATMDTLPDRGEHVFAVVTAKGSGTFDPGKRERLTFSGYEWEVRQTPTDRGGPNDYDPRNAKVDAQGHLHLRLAQRDGRWTSAEIILTRALGYGTYEFSVQDTSPLDPAAVLGLLTWDELGAYSDHRELDIEISRWGDARNKDVQFVVQPQFVAANVFRFKAPPGRLTHSLEWALGRATFTTFHSPAVGTARSLVARHEFTRGVPVPGDERVHLNLLYYRAAPHPPDRDVEVVVEKFVFLP